ncbi:ribonuclease D [Roseococcus sp. DSY-14]|uniref:ribonuclease D n=1 Tax=Roseococcus sp. DSY-14 TaxID=3369650 RepID=UPI00387B0DC8
MTRLITDAAELAALCERLRQEPFVTVDTEFMRERTYYPELCVVQLAGEEEVVVVDTLAEGMDLAPLGDLLADPAVVKVFHAARQDVEIFLLRFGAVPTPIFDTQIAAMVAGFGDQASYDALVRGLVGVSLDKAHRFSDWAARPLSPAQIEYAAADVTHLRAVYRTLREKLLAEGRLDWVAEEMEGLLDPRAYVTEPEDAWLRLKPKTTNRRYLATLRATAAWREREAQRLDIPRGRVVKDESLLEIAAAAPRDAEGLARIRGVSEGFARGKSGAGLLAALAEAASLPESGWPQPLEGRRGAGASPALVALLKVLLAAAAEAHNVAPRLLADTEDLERLAAEAEPEIRCLQGWRREAFGEDALALKAGRLALAAAGRRVRLIRVS